MNMTASLWSSLSWLDNVGRDTRKSLLLGCSGGGESLDYWPNAMWQRLLLDFNKYISHNLQHEDLLNQSAVRFVDTFVVSKLLSRDDMQRLINILFLSCGTTSIISLLTAMGNCTNGELNPSWTREITSERWNTHSKTKVWPRRCVILKWHVNSESWKRDVTDGSDRWTMNKWWSTDNM